MYNLKISKFSRIVNIAAIVQHAINLPFTSRRTMALKASARSLEEQLS